MSVERLDKILSLCTGMSRNDVKKLIRSGAVTVDGAVVTDAAFGVDETARVLLSGEPVWLQKHVYIMLNKPKGVVSAAEGKEETTVVDILPAAFKRRGLFPAGRLDKDTTGFCLITDDGDFAHRILSPRSHVPKTYRALLDKPIDIEMARAAFADMTLNGEKLLPAQIDLIQDTNDLSCEIVLSEGKYHQIKRMFGALGYKVLELERTKMGSLKLDSALPSGACRYLTEEELERIV